MLESCQFAEFWKVFSTLSSPQGSDDKLRSAILNTMALTYRSAPTKVVLEALNTKKVPSGAPIESAAGDCVTFAATADNTKRTTIFQKGVSFSDVSAMLMSQ